MIACRAWLVYIAALVLAACGGGGGGNDESVSEEAGTRTPYPELSQDSNPEGQRLDYRHWNYFPAGSGDRWVYERRRAGVAMPDTVTREVISSVGGQIVIAETSDGTVENAMYRRTEEGIVAIRPLEGIAPHGVSEFVGDLLDYPELFYPRTATRRMVRQGSWGEDVDGDGVPESYRLEFTQVFIGLEPLELPAGSLTDVARFRNAWTLTLMPSSLRHDVQTTAITEEAWWAAGIGLVRSELVTTDGNGSVLEPTQTLVLTEAMIDGRSRLAPTPDGALVKVQLVHNALVYDPARDRYYASIPGSVPATGNRIAIVNPYTGEVGYPAGAAGSEPSAMAVNADATALFVALRGSGEVVKLRLSDFKEVWRVRLPAPGFYGQLQPAMLAASPVDPDAVAASMAAIGVSPSHAGVVLIRGGEMLPTGTQGHTGSNLIAFGDDGEYVYGFNNETTEFGLRRIAVQANGLAEQQVVAGLGNFGTTTLSSSQGRVIVGKAVYRAPDLALLGQASVNGSICRPFKVHRLVCDHGMWDGSNGGTLAVVDATTLVILATPQYQPAFAGQALTDIVPGAGHLVGLSLGAAFSWSASSEVWFFTDASLQ
nr:hypothetical protein [uncultured Caldimonas sp.]